MHERQPRDDLAAFMAAYTQAWNSGDLEAIVDAYATHLLSPEQGRWRSLGDVVHA